MQCTTGNGRELDSYCILILRWPAYLVATRQIGFRCKVVFPDIAPEQWLGGFSASSLASFLYSAAEVGLAAPPNSSDSIPILSIFDSLLHKIVRSAFV